MRYASAASPKFAGLTAQQRGVDDMYAATLEDVLAGCAAQYNMELRQADQQGYKSDSEGEGESESTDMLAGCAAIWSSKLRARELESTEKLSARARARREDTVESG